MQLITTLILIFLSLTVKAEVFKCIAATGKTIYQAKPCLTSGKEKQLEIKTDPKTETEAKAKLEAIELQLDAKKAEQLENEKAEAIQRHRLEELDALKRSANAQQQQALTAQRQAEAMENQNQLRSNQLMILPPLTPPVTQSAPMPVITPETQKQKTEIKDKENNLFRLKNNFSQ
jgi:hypothetical protein